MHSYPYPPDHELAYPYPLHHELAYIPDPVSRYGRTATRTEARN